MDEIYQYLAELDEFDDLAPQQEEAEK